MLDCHCLPSSVLLVMYPLCWTGEWWSKVCISLVSRCFCADARFNDDWLHSVLGSGSSTVSEPALIQSKSTGIRHSPVAVAVAAEGSHLMMILVCMMYVRWWVVGMPTSSADVEAVSVNVGVQVFKCLVLSDLYWGVQHWRSGSMMRMKFEVCLCMVDTFSSDSAVRMWSVWVLDQWNRCGSNSYEHPISRLAGSSEFQVCEYHPLCEYRPSASAEIF